ncbi:protein PLANT CADMIUM RESISTANCE 12 [Diospyros lotus]|uniref:protein PLANT CADMIUM RESISTANCE 12 n=1 Tax=Diospyros lotus TaxID=55363 RepID=UPI00224CE0E7|nr:protein PLANT CADMIUM RESISTANCE 12 [Diospyros lotus]
MSQNGHRRRQPSPPLPTSSLPPFPNHLPQGQWTSGLCGCFQDPKNCLMTAIFPCITMGQIAHIVDRGTISCCAASVIYVALAYAGCAPLYGCTYRTKLRGLFGLPERPLPDGLVHCLCCFCALCQDYRELKNRGTDPSLGWEDNVEKWNQNGATTAPTVATGMNR